MAVAGFRQQAAESASRRRRLAANLVLAALPPALAGALLILSPPVELRKEPAIRPPAPILAASPPLWYHAEIPVLEAVLRRDSSDGRARYRLLQLYAAENDASAAQEQLKLLIEQHPESPLAVKAAEDWIAALIRTKEEQDLCWLARVWERAAAQRPDSAPALANAAAAMERCGRFWDAIPLLERARRLDPENPQLLQRLAGLFVRVAYSRAPEIGPALRRQARLRLISTLDAALLAHVAQYLLEWPSGGLASNPLMFPPAGLHEHEKDGELYLRRALRLDPANPIAKRLQDLQQGRCPPPEPSEALKPGEIRVGKGPIVGWHLLENPKPEYPDAAKKARIEGRVRLRAVIGKYGTIRTIEPVSGHPLLIDAAIHAAKQWRYRPVCLNGEPVEVVTMIEFEFTLPATRPPANQRGSVPRTKAAPAAESERSAAQSATAHLGRFSREPR